MDKELLKRVLVIGMVILFITSSFFVGGGFFQPSVTASGKNQSGNAVFNGTIRTYVPEFYLPLDTNQSVLDALRTQIGVKEIAKETTRYKVTTETRDDVFPLAEWLRSQNVTPAAVAFIAPNGPITVQTFSGDVNASVRDGVVPVAMEPLLDLESEVTVALKGAVVNNNILLSYQSADILLSEKDILIEAKVDALNYKTYSYTIPWEERNTLGNLSRFGEYEYKKVDSMLFSPPLTLSQIVEKKQRSYVIYIDSQSAQLDTNFDSAAQLNLDFADTPFTLPPSKLVIVTNGTPDLPFEPAVRHSYVIVPLGEDYDFGDKPLLIESEKEFGINSTITVNITALVLNEKVISIRRAGLPS